MEGNCSKNLLEELDTMSLVTDAITNLFVIKSCWALWMPYHVTIDTFVHNLHSLWYAIQDTLKLHLIKPRIVEFIKYSMLYFINTRWGILFIYFSCRCLSLTKIKENSECTLYQWSCEYIAITLPRLKASAEHVFIPSSLICLFVM